MLACAGCVPSLHPLITDEKAVFDPALVGTWVQVDGVKWRRLSATEVVPEGGDRWTIERDGETNSYSATLVEAGQPAPEPFALRLAHFSSGTFIELAPAHEPSDSFRSGFFMPVSMFMKLELSGDEANVFPLDESSLETKPGARGLRLAHATTAEGVVITADTRELQRFVERHGADGAAFERGELAMAHPSAASRSRIGR